MKRIILIAVLIVAAALGYFMWKGGSINNPNGGTSSTTPTANNAGSGSLRTYNDPDGRFTFQYPAAFAFSGPEASSTTPNGWSVYNPNSGMVFVKVTVPRSYLPNTNFAEAWFTVGWSNNPGAISSCTKALNNPGVSASDATIDALAYKKFESSDAAAGNRYDSTGYHAIFDGDCWALEYTIHYGNIQNYDPSLGVKEFDETALKSQLDAIARSFKFKFSSD